MPWSTLSHLPVDVSQIKQSHAIVRAFDGTQRDIKGTILITLEISFYPFEIEFHVMDIAPAYNCLLR